MSINKLLVVEDEEPIGNLCVEFAGEFGFDAKWVQHPDEAWRLLEAETFHIVLTDTDFELPGRIKERGIGVQFARNLTCRGYQGAIIGMSADHRRREQYIATDACYFLSKPFKIAQFGRALDVGKRYISTFERHIEPIA
tara:strand:+ start:56 stop:472 length:417 start_codon:yes stop_codon:yes gene_type:complete